MPASKDKKVLETDATQTIKSAMNLQAHVEESELAGGIMLPPVVPAASATPDSLTANLVNAISREIVQREAIKARNLARRSQIESEIELEEAKRRMESLKRGNEVSSPPLGMFSSILGNSKSAVVKTVLESLPMEKRAEWLERNKDLISEGANTNMQSNTSTSSPNTLTDVANLIATLSREQREGLLWLLQVKDAIQPQQTSQPSGQQSPQSTSSVGAIVDMIKELNQQNREMIMQLTNMFSDTVRQMQEMVKQIQHESKSAQLELQQQLVNAQRELYETKSQTELNMLREELKTLKERAANVPHGVLTLADIPMLKQMLTEVGLSVGASDVAAEETKRKWDLEEKKLELAAERERQAMALEQERLKKTSEALGLIRTVISTAVDASKIEKAFESGGSQSAKKVINKIKEQPSSATGGGVS